MNEYKPILKYPGAKWSRAEWIVSYLPPHSQYVEPYCGSAAVFMNKPPSEQEVLNDLSSSIVNLFRVIREHGEELAALLDMTPWAREEYEASFEQTGNEIEDARRFAVRCWQAHGSSLLHKTGWRHRGQSSGGTTARLWKQLPDRLLAVIDRLKDAEIEHKPALEVIAEYPNALLYVDPPYVLDTRHSVMYEHEMKDIDHLALLHALKKHKGPVVLSGYEHDLYSLELESWHKITMPSVAEHGKIRTEVLWLNRAAVPFRQMSMFENEAS